MTLQAPTSPCPPFSFYFLNWKKDTFLCSQRKAAYEGRGKFYAGDGRLCVTVLEKVNVDQPGMAVHVSNPSVQEAEAGG